MSNRADSADEPDWAADPVRLSLLSPAEQVAILKRCAPRGRDLFVLALIDPLALDDASRIDLLTMFEEISRFAAAARGRVLAAVHATDTSELHLAEEQVALALTIPGRTAQRELQVAATLQNLPATAALLEAGQISAKHADIVAEASWQLPPELASELERAVLGRAPHQTPTTFARAVRRAAVRLDPADAEARHQRARLDRRVGCSALDDGMVSLPVILPADEGQAIFTRLTAAAAMLPKSDQRTMDQRRADLLVDAVLTGIPVGALPQRQGRAPSIQVVVSADTLLDIDDEPGHLTGYGPITAETARRLAADESGTWRRMLTDPGGRLVDISEHRYRPSRRLREFVAVRDDVCSFPTCNQPGYRCEFEHITPYGQGGVTCACNGALACRRHNRCKIRTGWQYRRNDDGSFTWTTSTGHEYRSEPVERWPLSPAALSEQPGGQPGRPGHPEHAVPLEQPDPWVPPDHAERPAHEAVTDTRRRPDHPARAGDSAEVPSTSDLGEGAPLPTETAEAADAAGKSEPPEPEAAPELPPY
ncbi:MAG TPA: DUF222 domain-containing protein [Jatrophihabitans sp.]|nr:DUF222 domain-containing protein [Jatrophihabitans sp.]